ncbi:MAG TPA: UDP-N-acetylmuramate dehydrogenase [Chloroflexota bacterium]|nr:UDP-N-acetylmuramate dehydrogenase [Chloroflexota bacterium]
MIASIPEALRDRFGDKLRVDEPLAKHTSFLIGGPADLFVSARTKEDIVDAIVRAAAAGLPWLILGRGSNVLIDERGVRGLVIRNDASGFSFDDGSDIVRCDSGARLPSVGAQTARAGLTGLEWAVGIPGSVGGGVVMNAGAHGGCIADALVSAEILEDGARTVCPVGAFEHSYRVSRLQRERQLVVLGAEFRLERCAPSEALARVQSYRRHRQETQPTDPGAGSIFRNPPGHSAGALIDRAGLKGTRHGGAIISPRHGNFIVNAGAASSSDVRALVDLARETVARQFGICLELEVELIGPTRRRTLNSE